VSEYRSNERAGSSFRRVRADFREEEGSASTLMHATEHPSSIFLHCDPSLQSDSAEVQCYDMCDYGVVLGIIYILLAKSSLIRYDS
jgi:hypothetical protein